MHRWFFLVLVTASCGSPIPYLRADTVGRVGCPEEEIVISEVKQPQVGAPTSWVATCRGVRYYCANNTGMPTGVSCTAELAKPAP